MKSKNRLRIAAAIDPDIYVLDEPSSNLDAYAIADFRQLLFTLKSQGKTIIISEHRLYYLSGLFDRVLYLKDGEIEGDYTAEEFCACRQDSAMIWDCALLILRGFQKLKARRRE